MRALAGACLIALLCGAAPARADDAASVSAADHGAIEQVINGQLDAFRRDAGETAFGFASPAIRSMFGTAPNFMAMVQQGFPPVYRSRSSTFEQLETMGGRIVQRVLLTGADGTRVLALYTMEREPDGTWRIDGCVLTRPDDVTT